MAWPDEAGSLIGNIVTRRRPEGPRRRRTKLLGLPAGRCRYHLLVHGGYRVFGPAVYRIYRNLGSPPTEADEPWQEVADLPATPDEAWGDGDWFISMSRFNGIYDSGFLPIGPAGETWKKLVLAAGAEEELGPDGPHEWSISAEKDESDRWLIRVQGVYVEKLRDRADYWAINWTTGQTEPADPDEDEEGDYPLPVGQGVVVLNKVLGPIINPLIEYVKVRLQTRRVVGSQSIYSEASEVKSLTLVAAVIDPAGSVENGMPR